MGRVEWSMMIISMYLYLYDDDDDDYPGDKNDYDAGDEQMSGL